MEIRSFEGKNIVRVRSLMVGRQTQEFWRDLSGNTYFGWAHDVNLATGQPTTGGSLQGVIPVEGLRPHRPASDVEEWFRRSCPGWDEAGDLLASLETPLDGDEDEDVETPAPVLVVLNEDHLLLPAQTAALDAQFGPGSWDILPIPRAGLTLDQIRELVEELSEARWSPDQAIVFASPIPAFISLAHRAGLDVRVFHNDRRVAREVPDGKGGVRVIHTVSAEGWVIV